MRRIVVGICAFLFLIAHATRAEQPVYVTVQQLLATPEKFAGKRVDVTGYYMSGTETSDLFASKHAQNRNSDQGIWIEVDFPSWRRPPEVAKFDFFDSRTVRVMGTFHYQPRPYLGNSVPYSKRFQGFGCYRLSKRAILDITYLQPAH
jgi:hypothetical protein